MSNNKMKKTQNNKKEDGKFKKINIKHGQSESARAAFDMRGEKDLDDFE